MSHLEALPVIAAALEARDRLLAALDHLDASVQDQIADVLIGGMPNADLAPHLAVVVHDRRNQLDQAFRQFPDGLPEEAWASAVKARDAWRGVDRHAG